VLSSVIEKCSDFEKNISQKHYWLDENSRFVCNTGHALQYCTVFLFTVSHSRVLSMRFPRVCTVKKEGFQKRLVCVSRLYADNIYDESIFSAEASSKPLWRISE
jgi:hypothetical protein